MIRDVTLAASGLLSRKMHGPSVFPPSREGIWNMPYNEDKWVESEGEDRYRRSLYTFLRRTSPYPSFMTFDATSREYCTVRRVRTNTPLQALTLLNDPAAFDAARALARAPRDATRRPRPRRRPRRARLRPRALADRRRPSSRGSSPTSTAERRHYRDAPGAAATVAGRDGARASGRRRRGLDARRQRAARTSTRR